MRRDRELTTLKNIAPVPIRIKKAMEAKPVLILIKTKTLQEVRVQMVAKSQRKKKPHPVSCILFVSVSLFC